MDVSGQEDKEGLENTRKRGRKHWVKSHHLNYNYALEEDIGWNQVIQMIDQTLVWKDLGQTFY